VIQPLRRAHRGAFLGLALLLPALLVSAWKVRRAPPVQELPEELLPGPPHPGPAGEDLLVYWAAAPHGDGEALPREAELVGSLRTGASRREPPPGKVALHYSLIEGRVVSAPARPAGPEDD